MSNVTPTMLKVLCRAASRDTGFVCPIPGLHAAAETAVLDALERRGLIAYPAKHSPSWGPPAITAAGRALLEAFPAKKQQT